MKRYGSLGLAFVPMTAAVGTGATLAPRIAKRITPRVTLAIGMLFAAVGEFLLTSVHPGGTYAANVLPGGVLGAFGLGLALVPATIVAVQGVDRAVQPASAVRFWRAGVRAPVPEHCGIRGRFLPARPSAENQS